MIEFKRICIPLTDICNLNCNYCFKYKNVRDLETVDFRFYNYLENLQITKFVCLTGGETLLRFDRIQKIFSHIPEYIHKKIITNGILLNENHIAYFNDLNVEVCISNDGENTKYSRGINILENDNIVKLIKKIKNLTISFVINSLTFNTQIISYIEKKLERTDYVPLMNLDVISKYSILPFLLKNNLCICHDKRLINSSWYKNSHTKRPLPMTLNITTKGEIWSNSAEAYICNYDVSNEEFEKAMWNSNYPSFDYCKQHIHNCIVKNNCMFMQNTNELICEYMKKKFLNQMRNIYVF